MQLSASATSKVVQPAATVSVIAIDDEVAVFLTEQDQQEVEVNSCHLRHRQDVERAGPIGIPLVKGEHVGELAWNLEAPLL